MKQSIKRNKNLHQNCHRGKIAKYRLNRSQAKVSVGQLKELKNFLWEPNSNFDRVWENSRQKLAQRKNQKYQSAQAAVGVATLF